MSTDGRGWIHGGYDLDTFQKHELQVVVIEAFIAYNLLKESNQLNGVVLIWLWQVDILQVDNESLTVTWPVHFTLRASGCATHLVQLLDYVERTGLRVTVDDGDLSRFHLLNLVSNHQVLATAFWTDQDERIALFEPWLDHSDVSLDTNGLYNWWQVQVLKALKLCLTGLGSEGNPRLSFWIKLVQKQILNIRRPLTR